MGIDVPKNFVACDRTAIMDSPGEAVGDDGSSLWMQPRSSRRRVGEQAGPGVVSDP